MWRRRTPLVSLAWIVALIGVALTSARRADADPPEARPPGEQGVLLRLGGDATIGPGEHVDAVIAIGGDARVAGTADSVVAIGGDVVLDDARVREVVVVGGRAVLRGATLVAEDVVLVGSTIERAPSAIVGGRVRTEEAWRAVDFWIQGVLLPLGMILALVLAGLAIAALVPRGVRRAEAALTGSAGKTLLAALLLYLVAPIAIALSFAAVVTIPAGVGVFLFVLPAIALFGYVLAGIRLGDAVIGAATKRNEAGSPYLAVLIGIPLLVLLGLIPVLGPIVTLAAGFLGGGAILLAAYRTIRRPRPGLPSATALPARP